MKKWIVFFSLFMACPLFAEEDSRIFIHPGRETFVNFPSASLHGKYTVSFLLPEPAVPLSKNYPVVVMLGIVPKDDAETIALFQRENPSLVVGINFEEKDYEEKSAEIEQFLSRELFPYLDTNYLTKTGPANRILAVRGQAAARIALRALQHPELFGALALVSPGSALAQETVAPGRILVVGTQGELALAQKTLEKQGKQYGPDFALRYLEKQGPWFNAVDTRYLWAPKEQTAIQYAKADVSSKTLLLDPSAQVALRIWVVLKNNGLFHYVPPAVRMSPPYLNWDASSGLLSALPGALPGTVRVRNFVDKVPFLVKIKLKKQ